MNRDNGKSLLKKYLNGSCTEQEKAIVENWLKDQSHASNWQWKGDEHKKRIKENIRKNIKSRKADEDNHKQKPKRNHIRRTLSIAASLVFICLALYIHKTSNYFKLNTGDEQAIENTKQTVTLTIGDQEAIDLKQVKSGTLAEDGSISINKNTTGKLVYERSPLHSADGIPEQSAQYSNETASTKPLLNTLTVPVGEQYQLTLPDGTNVWLNCESSLSFPSYFSGDKRFVMLQGEAYFEVAKNNDKPFVVQAKDQQIEVLGTHFNVAAYSDEDQTRTSLLEGAVVVSKGENTLKLTPGRQAVSTSVTTQLVERPFEPHAAVSWKDGYFVFHNQHIESVMNAVSRWYDVEIEIKNAGKKSKKINGTFSRSRSIDELLLYLEKLEVAEFKKEGRRVIVML